MKRPSARKPALAKARLGAYDKHGVMGHAAPGRDRHVTEAIFTESGNA